MAEITAKNGNHMVRVNYTHKIDGIYKVITTHYTDGYYTGQTYENELHLDAIENGIKAAENLGYKITNL
jgi:hypothetical protein